MQNSTNNHRVLIEMQYCNPHYAREHSHMDIMRCYVAHYIIFAILEVDHNIVSVNAILGLSFVI